MTQKNNLVEVIWKEVAEDFNRIKIKSCRCKECEGRFLLLTMGMFTLGGITTLLLIFFINQIIGLLNFYLSLIK